MSKSRLKFVTFDAVNTIIKVRPCPAQQYAEVAKNFGINVNEQNIRNAYEPSWTSMKFEYPNYGRNSLMKSEDWWKIFIARVFRNAGYYENITVAQMDGIASNLYNIFGTKESWEVVQGVQDMLLQLKKAGLKLAVVSNFDERLPIVLSSLGLQNHFDFLITSVLAGAEKPDSRIYEYALKQAGVKPQESIHIGDSLEEDCIPSKCLGIRSYLFIEDTNKLTPEIEAVVHDQLLMGNFNKFRDIVLSQCDRNTHHICF